MYISWFYFILNYQIPNLSKNFISFFQNLFCSSSIFIVQTNIYDLNQVLCLIFVALCTILELINVLGLLAITYIEIFFWNIFFGVYFHENEAGITKFKVGILDFALIFFVKSISTANDIKTSWILYKNIQSCIYFILNILQILCAWLWFGSNTPFLFRLLNNCSFGGSDFSFNFSHEPM